MKPFNINTIAVATITTGLAVGLTIGGCAKQGASFNKSTGTSSDLTTPTALDQMPTSSCSPSFKVTDPSMKPITQVSQLPKGTFQIYQITEYGIDAGTGTAYQVSAQLKDNFQEYLGCETFGSGSTASASSINDSFTSPIQIAGNSQSPNELVLNISLGSNQNSSDTSALPQALIQANTSTGSQKVISSHMKQINGMKQLVHVYSPDSNSIIVRTLRVFPSSVKGKNSYIADEALYTYVNLAVPSPDPSVSPAASPSSSPSPDTSVSPAIVAD